MGKIRRSTGKAITLYRTNAPSEAGGATRRAVIAEAIRIDTGAHRDYTNPEATAVVRVEDFATGTRYTLEISASEWRRVASMVGIHLTNIEKNADDTSGQRARRLEQRARGLEQAARFTYETERDHDGDVSDES
jgi:hypothetical protein